jgi:hypothetical protein
MAITPENIMDLTLDSINGAFNLEVDGILQTSSSSATSPYLFDNMTVTLNNVNSSKVNIYNNVLLKDLQTTFTSKIYSIATASNNNTNPSSGYDDTLLKNSCTFSSNLAVWDSNAIVSLSNYLSNPNDLLFVSKHGDQMSGPLYNTCQFQCEAGVGTLNGFVVKNVNLNIGSVSQMLLQTADTWVAAINQKVTPYGNQYGIDLSPNDNGTTVNVYNVRNKDGNIQHSFNGGAVFYNDIDIKGNLYRGGILWNPLTSMPDTIDHLTINNDLTVDGNIYKNGVLWTPPIPDPLNLNAINCEGLFASKQVVVGSMIDTDYFSLEYNIMTVNKIGDTMGTLSFISTRNNIRVTPYDGQFAGAGFFSQLFAEDGSAFLANNGANWTQTSDKRIKTNIKTLNPQDSLTKILNLNPISFEWIRPEAHGGVRNVEGGFIAQEVKDIFPSMVKSTGNLNPLEKDLIDDGEQLTLQIEILPHIVSSIQSLYNKIATLENEIVILKNIIK